MSVEFEIGKLNVVIGATGSGKTSLLLALLGEMQIESGQVYLPKHKRSIRAGTNVARLEENVAYCAETLWLMNGTIKSNILFGSSYNEARYNTVIRAYALDVDLKRMTKGDETQVGEKGVELSGGQKQRVSLAQAVYSSSRHLLLDDCLSAVDRETAKRVYEQCLVGDIARGRTVVLMSHNVDLAVKKAAKIIVMEEGRVKKIEVRADQNEDSDSQVDFSAIDDLTTHINSGEDTNPETQLNSDADEDTDSEIKLSERTAVGKVTLSVYLWYLHAVGGTVFWLGRFFFFLTRPFLNIGLLYWVKLWTGYMTDTQTKIKENRWYMLIYIIIGLGYTSFAGAGSVVSYIGGMHESRTIFQSVLTMVTFAKTQFFNTQTVGRIMNRFSRDVCEIDERLFNVVSDMLSSTADAVFAVALISGVVPEFVLVSVVIGGMFYGISEMYMQASRELKRIESVLKTPVYEQYGEKINGLVTIRAYGAEDEFLKSSLEKVEEYNRGYFYRWRTNRWLVVWLDMGNWMIAVVVGGLMMMKKGEIDGGLAGMTVMYAMNFSEYVLRIVKMYGNVEMSMNSVERLKEYEEVEMETDDREKVKGWPKEGKIELKGLCVEYGQERVLEDVNLTVGSSEKVGIIGRTGSGKSTLVNAIFRMIDIEEGKIEIDGVDIKSISLQELRRKIGIVPQEVTLFQGTIRSNLDMFGEFQEDEMNKAIRDVGLNGKIELDTEVEEGGKNYSQGERQLVCLARMMLKRLRILVLDEATASIDYDLDAVIHKATASEAFRQTTVITIAHRIETVTWYEHVILMDGNEVVAKGKPNDVIGESL